jgi:formylmethanofuran dehydrogenase subunit E
VKNRSCFPILLLVAFAALACGAPSQHQNTQVSHDSHHSHHSHNQHQHHPPGAGELGAKLPPEERELHEITAIHGGAGPWAVAGYRMGKFALQYLELPHGSFDLEVIHHTPQEVQYSCMADGAAAATGASLGKLNLKLTPATATETRTEYRNRTTGKSVVLQVTKEFRTRFFNVPREQLSKAGREVLHLMDTQIFETVPNHSEKNLFGKHSSFSKLFNNIYSSLDLLNSSPGDPRFPGSGDIC